MSYGFENFLRERMRTEKTIKGYKQDVKMFLDYMEEKQIEEKDIKEVDVKEYIITLMEKQYSNNTIARKNSALRLYFKHLRKTGVLMHNPMEDIKQPELQTRSTEVTEAIIDELLDIAENERDKLMICLMYYEKIKPVDFLKLKKDKYDVENNILYLEDRVKLLQPQTKTLMLTYIKEKEEKEILFINQHKKNLSPSGVYFIIKKYLKEIGREEIRPIDFTKKEKKD